MKRLLLPLLAALALPTAVNAEKMFNAIDTCARAGHEISFKKALDRLKLKVDKDDPRQEQRILDRVYLYCRNINGGKFYVN